MMRLALISFCMALMTFISLPAYTQPVNQQVIDSIFNPNGEICFKFRIRNKQELSRLTRIISIDDVRRNIVIAYANRSEFEEFLKLGKEYKILQSPGTLIKPEDLKAPEQPAIRQGQTQWDFYPTYTQYVDFMTGFAEQFPSICRLDTVGYTLQGRLILAVRISDNVNDEEAEPQVLYTSSIHGDETTAYVLMLHLIDYLLQNYGTDPELTELINTTEIFINPLANPDGTYHGGNNSVYGAIRYNANYIDLNRNYPDPKAGPHPDGNEWQVETQAWMAYAEANHFTLSVNFHGGAEVFNYPWDTWIKLTADDQWWQFVGREWADTVHHYGPPGYFTFLDNGITNGNAWYEITGGRQDYMNYWHQCREVTLEISDIKLLPVSQLIPYWNYNYRSFINYMKQAQYGFRGIVTDTVTDMPVEAKIFIQGHDKDNSEVYSRLPSGFYTRPIYEGSYKVTVTAPGYYTKTIPGVQVWNRQTTVLDVQLRPLTFDAQDQTEERLLIYPNPCDGGFRMEFGKTLVHSFSSYQVLNLMGEIIHSSPLDYKPDRNLAEVDLRHLPAGVYFIKVNTGYRILMDKLIIRK